MNIMNPFRTTYIRLLWICLFTLCLPAIQAQDATPYPANYARAPRFKALIYYSTQVEEAHRQFAEDGIRFFKKLNYGEGFIQEFTTDFTQYPYEKLREFDVVVMLNAMPADAASRQAFEQYMEQG